MKNTNIRKMEAAEMEAVVGGAYIGIFPIDMKNTKEAVDSIGEQFKNVLLTGRGKC